MWTRTAVVDRRDESVVSVRIKLMLDFIHLRYADHIGPGSIADAAHISEREAFRIFGRTIGMTPVAYMLKHRISVAARLLAETGLTVTEVALSTGFNTPSYFTKVFKQRMRLTPSQYRNSSLEK